MQLLRSQEISSPVALGSAHRVVIIPESLWNQPSQELLTAVVAHELAHVARRDFVTNLIGELLFVIVAFHPAVWYLRRQLQRSREMACDELVTTLVQNPRAYARSVVQVAAMALPVPDAGYSLRMFEGGELEERIRRVLRQTVINAGRARIFFATGLMALFATAVIAVGFAVSARGQSAFDARMKHGVAAYNSGDFATATREFTAAVSLQPSEIPAKLFLANSVLSEFYAQAKNPILGCEPWPCSNTPTCLREMRQTKPR